MEQLEQPQILPTAKKYCQKLSNMVMEKQSTHFICIIYPSKYNSTLLLMHEEHAKAARGK